MAKYEELFEDHAKLFTDFISQVDSLSDVNIKILGCANLKEICKVVKANDLLKHMTNEDIVILLNEHIFEQLEDSQKKMIVEENVAKVYYDIEKDKITLIQPDVHTFSLLLQKFGYPEYERLMVSIKTLYAQQQEEEQEAEN